MRQNELLILQRICISRALKSGNRWCGRYGRAPQYIHHINIYLNLQILDQFIHTYKITVFNLKYYRVLRQVWNHRLVADRGVNERFVCPDGYSPYGLLALLPAKCELKSECSAYELLYEYSCTNRLHTPIVLLL